MDNTKEEIEIEDYKQLKTTDIAKNLDIAESTVRKYAQVLEKQGYSFRKDPVLGRIYTSIDELAINELIKLRKSAKVGLDMAAEIVATRRTSKNMDVSPTYDVQPIHNKDIALQNIEKVMHEIRYVKEEMSTIREIAATSMTKSQGDYLIQTVEKILGDNEKLRKEKEEMEVQNEIWKEKVDLVVDYIQQEKEEKKKSFIKRMFG